MRRFYWLVRRELWEHKNAAIWTPLALAAFLLVLMAATTAYGYIFNRAPEQIYTESLGQDLAYSMGSVSVMAAILILWTAALLQFIYSVSTIFDERNDRSLQFWKSLPSGDTQVILSKAFLALVIIPLAAIAAVVLFTLGVMALDALATGSTEFRNTNSEGFHIGRLAWLLVAYYPGYLLCCVASVGWAFLVSSLAGSKPILWAIGIPVLLTTISVIIAEAFGLEDSSIGSFFLLLIVSGLPGMHTLISVDFANLGLENTYAPAAHYQILFNDFMPFLLALTGVVGIFVTIRLRRRGLR